MEALIKTRRNKLNHSELLFQKAKLEDASELARIATEAFAEDKEIIGMLPPEIESIEKHQRIIQEGHYYTIVTNGVLSGGMFAVPQEDGSVLIGAVFISPNFQGCGIGRCALRWLERSFPSASRFELETPLQKLKNIKFYEKAGYYQTNVTQISSEPAFSLVLMAKSNREIENNG